MTIEQLKTAVRNADDAAREAWLAYRAVQRAAWKTFHDKNHMYAWQGRTDYYGEIRAEVRNAVAKPRAAWKSANARYHELADQLDAVLA